MKPKLFRCVLAGLLCCFGAGCTTAYDAYGYPQQVVDPATAVVGAAAVGLLAYGLANSNDHGHHRSHYRSYNRGHYGHGGYRHGGYHGPSHYSSYGGGYDYCD